MDFKTSAFIIFIGFGLIILNFPFLVYELSVGYTFSYGLALTLAMVAKTIAEIFSYCISKYIFKNCCLQILSQNQYFKFIEKAVVKYPWQIANLLRANVLIPLFVVNFGSGIINISFI